MNENNPIQDNRKYYMYCHKVKLRSSYPQGNESNDTGNQPIRGCLYCASDDCRANNCNNIVKTEVRKIILAEKRLCFNCIGGARYCKSKNKSQICHKKHHTSICDLHHTSIYHKHHTSISDKHHTSIWDKHHASICDKHRNSIYDKHHTSIWVKY